MRYAIISDIHSNLEALTAFFEEAKRLQVDKTICLGDIVGYNANPNECVDIIREKNIKCIMGNHDLRAAGLDEPYDFNLLAAESIEWTKEVLTEENKKFLEKLPRKIRVNNRFLAVHGWINDTDRYVFGAGDAKKNFQLLEGVKNINLCFFGHTHVPITYLEMDGSVKLNLDTTVKIDKGVNYLINPGGLGQPRDKDPRGSFLVYDTDAQEVNFYRVEYDVQVTTVKIIEAGLSPRLAERLKLGW
ncbi:MAG: metallophosphoesterase family protein [Thermodesulfobacteriota bacterium]|nr:MAG: metallophosphoesterase family protein [Thermodesulfobacteriota bacterium]